MGNPMAARLLAGGHELVIHTRTQARSADLLKNGATWAATPAAVARAADVVFICVTDTPDVQRILTGPDGVLGVARPGLIVVDHSTISPKVTRQLAADLSACGATLLDAPVSGGDIGAKNGTLSIMVGGDETALANVHPLLTLMGKTITHCGPSGAGQLTKLTNQILVTINNLAACEALTFAIKNGLDPEKTVPALAGGAAGSWQWQNLAPRMAKGDFAPGFMIDLQVKDLRLLKEAIDDAGLNLEASALVRGLFERLQRSGLGREGTQALFKAVSSQ
jgi:3-hydroxyisobutyrate dehydrogenase-like beta-hydroxyacid dehydrogenase